MPNDSTLMRPDLTRRRLVSGIGALALSDSGLYAGGVFTVAGGKPLNQVEDAWLYAPMFSL